MLGHASAAMTLDVYADLFDDDLTGVADKLLKLWAKCGHGGPAGSASKHKYRIYQRGYVDCVGALGEIRTHTVRVLNPFPLSVGIRGRQPSTIKDSGADGFPHLGAHCVRR